MHLSTWLPKGGLVAAHSDVGDIVISDKYHKSKHYEVMHSSHSLATLSPLPSTRTQPPKSLGPLQELHSLLWDVHRPMYGSVWTLSVWPAHDTAVVMSCSL